ncbi:MAG: O-antigen ligase family protein [Acidobacteriota bacterium]
MTGQAAETPRSVVIAASFGFAALTGAAAVLGNGNVIATLAPVLVVAGLACVCLAPLRVTLLVLTFLGLAVDTPGDAQGLWQSPMAPLGRLLIENLNKSLPINSLKISLLAIVLVSLLFALWLRTTSSRRPAFAPRTAANPVMLALLVSVLTVLGLSLYGLLRGGDLMIINLQTQRFILTAVLACLLAYSLRGTRDYIALGAVITLAACIKAGIAIWVRQTIDLPADILEFTTTHGDSMLFTTALAVLLAVWSDRSRVPHRWIAVPAAAWLLFGIVANARRLAWLQVAFTLLTLFMVTPWTRGKRTLARAALLASPLLVIYVAVGWHSTARVFAPVNLLRSVQDGKSNRSTLDRDIENFNLITTFSGHPVLGTGFGHPYVEAVKGDDISMAFPEYRYVPHNSVLGLWAAGGLLGFIGIWAAPIIGLFRAARCYYRAGTAPERMAAFAVIAAVEIYMLQSWGDMGFVEPKAVFLLGAALGVAARLTPFSSASVRTLDLAA